MSELSACTDGLGRMRERDAFKGEHLSLARNPTRLLGIILGSLALGDAGLETLAWCREVLEKMRQKGLTGVDPLVPYLFFRALGTKIHAGHSSGASFYELAFVDWAIRHQMHQNEPSLQQLNDDRQSILFQAATIFVSNRHRRPHSSGLA